jgi:tRNA (guanine37-N1)-methyltransferase
VRIDVFTIFPEYLDAPLGVSLLGRARAGGVLDVRLHDPRTYTTDQHHSVDDAPFGGGAGMVMMPEPLFAAVEAAQPPRPLLLLSASGRRFDQARARELASGPGFSLICGRYEGVDQRVADHLCDGELSVGDFVLSGGEGAALIVIDAVARLLPGVMGNEASAGEESFTTDRLEYPQYTRPAEFRGWAVPEVLRSGDHGKVARWRAAQALRRTLERRPDLVGGELSPADAALLAEFPEPGRPEPGFPDDGPSR